jgi:hypothetical protein
MYERAAAERSNSGLSIHEVPDSSGDAPAAGGVRMSCSGGRCDAR